MEYYDKKQKGKYQKEKNKIIASCRQLDLQLSAYCISFLSLKSSEMKGGKGNVIVVKSWILMVNCMFLILITRLSCNPVALRLPVPTQGGQ